MHVPKRRAGERESIGVVHSLDTVNREVVVYVDGELRIFDVPIGCTVVLHGERIKFRLVQPQDRVRITHANREGLRIALAIEVQPDDLVGHAVRALSGMGQPARR